MKKVQSNKYSKGRLVVRRRSLLQWLVLLVSLWPFLINPVGQLPGMAGYLKYLPDGILMVLLILALGRSRFVVQRKLLPPLRIVVGLFLYAFLVYLFRYQSAAYFLWGFRNLFRFWIAFFAYIAFLDGEDAATWFKALDILFWVNAALSVVQFAVLGVKGDYLGGIFGIRGGTNGYTMLLLTIVVGKSLLSAFNGTEKFWVVMLKCGVSLLITAMAEMKFYYFVFILLLLGASLLTRFSGKKVVILLLGAVTMMLGISLLTTWLTWATSCPWKGFGSMQQKIPTLPEAT